MPLNELRAQFLGKSLTAIEAFVAGRAPGGAATGDAEAWQAALFARFRADLQAMPGVERVLSARGRVGRPFCVASSSSFERLDVALGAVGLHDSFPHLFSAEQVAHGKPAPDLFLFAARQMGMDPARVLVIEDSPHGIAAARAAGMVSVGFVGGSHVTGIAGAPGALLVQAVSARGSRPSAALCGAARAVYTGRERQKAGRA